MGLYIKSQWYVVEAVRYAEDWHHKPPAWRPVEGLFNQGGIPYPRTLRPGYAKPSQSRLPLYNCLLSSGDRKFNEISSRLSSNYNIVQISSCFSVYEQSLQISVSSCFGPFYFEFLLLLIVKPFYFLKILLTDLHF